MGLFWCARHAIITNKPSTLSNALSFLVRDLEPQYLWWELVEAWKKLLLVGFAVLVSPGSIEQLICAFVISLISGLFVAILQPFKDNGDDYFAKGCNFALTSLFFFSVILKVSVLTDEVDSVMSQHLRSRFSFDAGLVSIAMVLSIIGALALATVMATRQLVAAARLPIIKLKATKTPPQLPLAKSGIWHLFLSHIWGTGQDQCATIKRQLCLLMPGVSIFLDVDDLKSIDALDEYIGQSAVIMIFVSKGYFQSKNCLREAHCTVEKGKAIALVHDSADYLQNYTPLEEIKAELGSEKAVQELVKAQGGDIAGRGLSTAQLREAIFLDSEPSPRVVIPWHRIKDFQLISLKMLAEEVIRGCPASPGSSKALTGESIDLYIPGELQKSEMRFSSKVQLYASPHNPGAAAVADDLRSGMRNTFTITRESASATHFLLYLNDIQDLRGRHRGQGAGPGALRCAGRGQCSQGGDGARE